MPRKRGRRKKTKANRLQGQMWFTGVSRQSGLTAPELERLRRPESVRTRDAKSGQSNDWKKYEAGTRSPKDRHREDDPVAWAERYFPGTAQWFRSPLWELLSGDCLLPRQSDFLIAEIPFEIRRDLYGLTTAPRGFYRRPLDATWLTQLASMDSFYAFAVLAALALEATLPDCKSWHAEARAASRAWLRRAHRENYVIQTHWLELIDVLNENAFRAGDWSDVLDEGK